MTRSGVRIRQIAAAGLAAIVLAGGGLPAAAPALAAPPRTDPASTRAWAPVALPGATGNIIRDANITAIAVSPGFAVDGTIFAVIDGATAGIADSVAKSTDGGRTWGAPVDVNAGDNTAAAGIVAVAVSPNFATDNTVVAADMKRVYKSADGGATWAQLGATLGNTNVSIDNDGNVTDIRIAAIAVSPTYDGQGPIAVGLIDDDQGDVGMPPNGTFVWGLNGVLNWEDPTGPTGAGLVENVMAIAFSPAYATDATILAIGATEPTGLRVHSWAGSTKTWDSGNGLGDAITLHQEIGPFDLAAPYGNARVVRTSLAVPQDFNSTDAARRTVFVGVDTTEPVSISERGGVYRTTALYGTPVRQIGGLAADVTSLSLTGTNANPGTLFIGMATNEVRRSTNHFGPAADITTTASTTNPIPGAGAPAGVVNTLVAAPPNFAATSTVFAGNSVAGTAQGSQTAFSISKDAGVNFAQVSLIDDPAPIALGRISDLAVSGSTIYLSMASGDDDAGLLADSLWLSGDSGATWSRVDTMHIGGVGNYELAFVGMSPNYANDGVAYWADGGTTAGVIRRTTNGGKTWVNVSAPALAGTITALAVLDTNTLVVAGSDGSARSSTDRGSIWSSAIITGAVGGIQSFARSPNHGTDNTVLAGDGGGQVFRSNDGGGSFVRVGSVSIGANIKLAVGFDAAYATNGTLYATGDSGTYRWVDGTNTTSWTLIDGAGAASIGIPGQSGNVLVVGPDGTLYAAQSISGAGARRTLDPTARGGAPVDFAVAPTSTYVNNASQTTSVDGNTRLGPMGWAPGSNVLYAARADSTPDQLWAYTDTWANPQLIPGLTSPIADAVAGTVPAGTAAVAVGSITFTWPNPAGATHFQLQVASDAGFASPLAAETRMVAAAAGGLTTAANLTSLPAATRYWWRVRALLSSTGNTVSMADLLSRWSQPATFMTAAPAGPLVTRSADPLSACPGSEITVTITPIGPAPQDLASYAVKEDLGQGGLAYVLGGDGKPVSTADSFDTETGAFVQLGWTPFTYKVKIPANAQANATFSITGQAWNAPGDENKRDTGTTTITAQQCAGVSIAAPPNVHASSPFVVVISAASIANLAKAQVKLGFDDSKVEFLAAGPFETLSSCQGTAAPSAGVVALTVDCGAQGFAGAPLGLWTVQLRGKGIATSNVALTLTDLVLTSAGGQPISANATRATIGLVAGVPGDLNGDTKLDVLDVVMLLKIGIGALQPTAAQAILGDLNRDGSISVTDAVTGLRGVVGLFTATTCGPSGPPGGAA